MSKRTIIGLVIAAAVVVALILLYGPFSAPADRDQRDLEVSPTSNATATGAALSTDSAGIHRVDPEAAPIAPGYEADESPMKPNRP